MKNTQFDSELRPSGPVASVSAYKIFRELKGGGCEMADQSSQKVQPDFKAKVGGFSTAVFLHDHDGRKIPSVVLEKSFTKDGQSWDRYRMTLLNSKEVDKLICVLEDTKRALYNEFE